MDLLWDGVREAVYLLATADSATMRIALLSLTVSGAATVLAALLGVPLGAMLALRSFPGRGVVTGVVNTGMGLPPVVVGLGVSLLLWRSGMLGPLALIYTPAAMVLAQFIVAAPLAAGLTRSAAAGLNAEILEALRVDGAPESLVAREALRAVRPQVIVAVAAAFGRAIAEVGASLMVGGNILNSTRIMTTAITLEVQRGEFARAIALGILLLALTFVINLFLSRRAGSETDAYSR